MANWPSPMQKRPNDKGEIVSIHEVISTSYWPQIFHISPSHVWQQLRRWAFRFWREKTTNAWRNAHREREFDEEKWVTYSWIRRGWKLREWFTRKKTVDELSGLNLAVFQRLNPSAQFFCKALRRNTSADDHSNIGFLSSSFDDEIHTWNLFLKNFPLEKKNSLTNRLNERQKMKDK